MTVYTAFGGVLPAGTTSTAAGGRTDSLVFQITSTVGTPTLTGVWYYVPSSETVLTGSSYTALVYTTVTGTTATALLTSNVGSGTFTAGAWNLIPLTSPVVLSTGVFYAACISSPNWLQFEHTMWGPGDPFAGGITAGPVNVPDQSGAPGGIQQGFIAFANTFPNQANIPGSFYGVDFNISTAAGASPSGLLLASII